MRCPSFAICFTRSSFPSMHSPTRKKVTRIPRSLRPSKSGFVYLGFGPSSKVSAVYFLRCLPAGRTDLIQPFPIVRLRCDHVPKPQWSSLRPAQGFFPYRPVFPRAYQIFPLFPSTSALPPSQNHIHDQDHNKNKNFLFEFHTLLQLHVLPIRNCSVLTVTRKKSIPNRLCR